MIGFKGALYFVMALFFLFNFIYRKISKEIKNDLMADEYMGGEEIWDLVKEESVKGNKKARIAVFAYYADTVCMIILSFLIFIVNIG